MVTKTIVTRSGTQIVNLTAEEEETRRQEQEAWLVANPSKTELQIAMQNLRTKKDIFVFPSLMKKYRKDINPARALYFEISNLMLHFNSDDERHIWLLGLFKENTWRQELIHSCLLDVQNIDSLISKYFHHMKKEGNVSLEMLHIIEIRKDLKTYVGVFDDFSHFDYGD